MDWKNILVTYVSETGTHDDSFVLVDEMKCKRTRPTKGDERDTSLGTRDGLGKAKHECQVAVDAVRLFKLSGSLNAFPCRCDLDEDVLFVDSDGLVECDDFPYLKSECH